MLRILNNPWFIGIGHSRNTGFGEITKPPASPGCDASPKANFTGLWWSEGDLQQEWRSMPACLCHSPSGRRLQPQGGIGQGDVEGSNHVNSRTFAQVMVPEHSTWRHHPLPPEDETHHQPTRIASAAS